MLFDNKDFAEKISNFGIDMTTFITDISVEKDYVPSTYKKTFDEPAQYKMGHYGKEYYEPAHNEKFVTAKEGFLKGSMYKNEYKPYKNLTYIQIVPKNDKEVKLLRVYELEFALFDLSLYLDINPDERNVFQLFKIYVTEFKKAKHEYEKMYGPLYLTDCEGEVYDWVDNPWPWDKDGGSMYV